MNHFTQSQLAWEFSLFVNAQTIPTGKINVQTTGVAAIQAGNDGHKEVKIETLNEKLQTAIKKKLHNFYYEKSCL